MGIPPSVPDFYQHQDWVPLKSETVNVAGMGMTTIGISTNGWETTTGAVNDPGNNANLSQQQFNFDQFANNPAGWCGPTAYADIFYDLYYQNFKNIFMTAPTPKDANWYTAMYGNTPANAANSNISQIIQIAKSSVPTSDSVQSYLNQRLGNNVLISNANPVDLSTGMVEVNVPGKGMVDTTKNVFQFTNLLLKNGSDCVYQIDSNQQNTVTGQGIWWTTHGVAVAGIDLKNNNILVANPDASTNTVAKGASTAGWVQNSPNFPGAQPANNPPTGSYGLMTPATAGLPVPDPTKVKLTDSTTYNPYYDTLGNLNTPTKTNYWASTISGRKQFNGTIPQIACTDEPNFNNTYVNLVASVGKFKITVNSVNAGKQMAGVRVARSSIPGEDDTSLDVQMPADAGNVDGIIVEPGTPTENPRRRSRRRLTRRR